MAAVLEAEGLARAFNGVQALDGVDLRVEPGDMIALVGPNGAGKTTLLNVLTGQQVPDRGRVTIAGRDVSSRAPSHRARWPAVRTYQNAGMFLRLTAVDNVAVAAVSRGQSHRAAVKVAWEVLTRLGMDPMGDERADRLSGGQKKLVDFARTLVVSDAQVALLDEPTAGVNPALSEILAAQIRKRQEEGMAFVIVSHDLPWVFELCPRVMVLAQGQRLMVGTPEEVTNDPRVIDAYLA